MADWRKCNKKLIEAVEKVKNDQENSRGKGDKGKRRGRIVEKQEVEERIDGN